MGTLIYVKFRDDVPGETKDQELQSPPKLLLWLSDTVRRRHNLLFWLLVLALTTMMIACLWWLDDILYGVLLFFVSGLVLALAFSAIMIAAAHYSPDWDHQ